MGTITGEEGLEPPTPRFVAACSNPLSYTPFFSVENNPTPSFFFDVFLRTLIYLGPEGVSV